MNNLKKWAPTLIVCLIIYGVSSLRGATVQSLGLGKESYHINGHFLLYFGLGISLYYATRNYTRTIILGMVYSVSDEFHQTFVPGRSWQELDLIIDGLGIVLALTYIWKLHPIVQLKLEKLLTKLPVTQK